MSCNIINPRRAYAQRGYCTWSVCLSVCLSTTILVLHAGYEAAYELYQQLQCYKSMKNKVAILLKRLRSERYGVKTHEKANMHNQHWLISSAHRGRIKLLSGYVSKSSALLYDSLVIIILLLIRLCELY